MKSIQKQTIKFKGFCGIDIRNTHTSPTGTSDLVNFRVGQDGTLIKRGGSRELCDVEQEIFDVWTGRHQGGFTCFAAGSEKIMEIDLISGDIRNVCPCHSNVSKCQFFYYRGNLYLADGAGIWRVDSSALTQPFGYVPLIAKDWSDNQVGKIHQPRNLLNDKGRLTYVISSAATSVLRLDDFISSVDSLYVNGKAVSSDRYTVGASSPYISVSGLAAGDRVSLAVTYKSSPAGLEALKSCTKAFVFGDAQNSRPLLFGGTDDAVIHCGSAVSDGELTASRKAYAQSDALYFPADCSVTVGDGRYGIRALSRHYDRLLIFTEGGTWMASDAIGSTASLALMKINSSVGVCSRDGAALLGNSPCAVGHGSIYRWTSETDEHNDCNAYSISEPIDSLLSEEFYRNARVFADKRHRELLFHCPQITERVWVYSEISKTWTSFTGLSAERFFETENCLGWVSGSQIFLFDDTLTTDYGAPIPARFVGNPIDLGAASHKRLSRVGMTLTGGKAVCGFMLDGKSNAELNVSFSGERHTCAEKRLNSRRVSYAVPTVTANDSARQQLHGLEITFK